MLKGHLRFKSHHYATEAYWDTNPESVCIRYCRIGHASHLECRNSPPRCTICARDYEALSHGCNIVGYNIRLGKPYQHSQIRCANCNGPYKTISPKCPKIRQARKQAIQQARNQKLQHLIPLNKILAVIPPRPPPTLEATGPLSTDRPAIEASNNTDTPISQESY
jgi:hypothetical protein